MLIGLTGKAGSGKDTAFSFIQPWAESQGRPVRRDAFADRLKVSAAKALGYEGTWEQCINICNQIKQPGWEIIVREPSTRLEHTISGREYLQFYGTEAHRQVFGTNFWVKVLLEQYPPDADELLVIPDVRFPNEAQAIHERGGQVWQIIRPGTQIAESTHLSEQDLDAAHLDAVLMNNGSLNDLQTVILSTLDTLVYA